MQREQAAAMIRMAEYMTAGPDVATPPAGRGRRRLTGGRPDVDAERARVKSLGQMLRRRPPFHRDLRLGRTASCRVLPRRHRVYADSRLS